MMNIQAMMKQAKKMQEKMEAVQKELAEKTYEAQSGGGMIKLTVSGKGELKSLKIDPSIIDGNDIEMLEDLIVAAFNQAKKNADEDSANAMSGMLPPGFKMPF